jgi:hypothetical protein
MKNWILLCLSFLMLQCSQPQRQLLIDETGILADYELDALSDLLDQHMRSGAVPVFVWLQDQTLSDDLQFEDFRKQAKGVSGVSKGLVVHYNLQKGVGQIIPSDPSIIPHAELNRIQIEVFDLRLNAGFVFEGLQDAAVALMAALALGEEL